MLVNGNATNSKAKIAEITTAPNIVLIIEIIKKNTHNVDPPDAAAKVPEKRLAPMFLAKDDTLSPLLLNADTSVSTIHAPKNHNAIPSTRFLSEIAVTIPRAAKIALITMI